MAKKNMLAVLARARKASNTPVKQRYSFDQYISMWGSRAGFDIKEKDILLTDRDTVIAVVKCIATWDPNNTPGCQLWCDTILKVLNEETNEQEPTLDMDPTQSSR